MKYKPCGYVSLHDICNILNTFHKKDQLDLGFTRSFISWIKYRKAYDGYLNWPVIEQYLLVVDENSV